MALLKFKFLIKSIALRKIVIYERFLERMAK